jgi:hypothetical protein
MTVPQSDEGSRKLEACQQCSRWLSAATPPVKVAIKNDPEDGSQHASVRSVTPTRGHVISLPDSGGVAAEQLNHRLRRWDASGILRTTLKNTELHP